PSDMTLQWSDELGASENDYDLFLLNPSLTGVLGSSTDVQDGTVDPFESIPSPGNDTGNFLVITRFSGEARFLHLNTHGGKLSISTAGQISGHAAAANAITVAAVNAAGFTGPFTGGAANPVETYSSDGPRRVFYAADGTPITAGNFTSTGGAV